MNPHEPTTWESGAGPSEGSVAALEALEGLAVAGVQRLASVRLSVVVGATLRAALDLVLGEPPSRRPLLATWDDGALEVTVPELQLEHMTAAGALLETVDGSLGPAREGRSFLARVPVLGPRGIYLMLQQGSLGLAVPWHAVVRIRMVGADALETLARREGCPILAPFVTVPRASGERPAVLVALGLRRAFLTADRLVWRMPAERIDPPEPAPGASLGPAVRTADGEVFWVADPGPLLKGVEPPPLPVAPPPRRNPPPPPPPAPARPAPPRAEPRSTPRLVELRREDVEPLREPPKPSALAPAPTRKALVAEDSVVGRIFLQRLLESQGFAVESMSTAGELRHALARQPWAALFVDVALPDSPRGAHLAWLASRPVVALVRDARDEGLAQAAGARLALRKPFERSDLLRVLQALGLRGETA